MGQESYMAISGHSRVDDRGRATRTGCGVRGLGRCDYSRDMQETTSISNGITWNWIRR